MIYIPLLQIKFSVYNFSKQIIYITIGYTYKVAY